MEEMYLNVIKNVTDDEDAHYLFNPVHIDSKKYTIESVKTPNNPLLNEEWMKDNPLIKQIMFILPLVRDFKGRKVKDMKISVNDEEFLVYSTDYSLLDFGCYGVTIIRALNESMPVNKELELSENSYKMIMHVLNGETDLKNSLKNLILEYKNNCSLNSTFNRARHEKGNNNYSLEKIVSDKKVIPKWDFFIAQNGLPLTDIFRYHPKKDLFDAHPDDFFRLNMNRKYELEAFSTSTLDFIHTLNCAALASS